MKRVFQLILGIICLVFVVLEIWFPKYINKQKPLSYAEAGTDFTKSFNKERIKRSLPIIPENWKNIDPLHFKIQTWENPDNNVPRHAEKTVIVDIKAQIEREVDRYDLKKNGKICYQVVIQYNFSDSIWTCTLRNTKSPEIGTGDRSGIRYAGDIIDTLSFNQALDTLDRYGLTRLNY